MASESENKKIIIVVEDDNAGVRDRSTPEDVGQSRADIIRDEFHKRLDAAAQSVPDLDPSNIEDLLETPLAKLAQALGRSAEELIQLIRNRLEELQGRGDPKLASATSDVLGPQGAAPPEFIQYLASFGEQAKAIDEAIYANRDRAESDTEFAELVDVVSGSERDAESATNDIEKSTREDNCCCCEEILEQFAIANDWLEQIANCTCEGAVGGGNAGDEEVGKVAGGEVAAAINFISELEKIAIAIWEGIKDIDRHIMSLASDVRQFSGNVLQAETEAQIAQMEAMIRRADTLGPELAEYIRARARFDATITDLVTELETYLIPSAVKALDIINTYLPTLIALVETGMKNTPFLKDILDWLQKMEKKEDAKRITDEINNFFLSDPTAQGLPGFAPGVDPWKV